jgi:hypothetical protein
MYKAKPDDTIVLIPSLRMHHLDTIDQIMREKVARGLSLSRKVTKPISPRLKKLSLIPSLVKV